MNSVDRESQIGLWTTEPDVAENSVEQSRPSSLLSGGVIKGLHALCLVETELNIAEPNVADSDRLV